MPNHLEHNLEQYKGLRISDIKPGDIRKVGPKPLSQLSKIEEEMIANNEESGVIFLMASKHLQGVSLNALAAEHHLRTGEILTAIFKHFGIPTLTRAEISEAKWHDPSDRDRVTTGSREQWNNPQYKAKHAEGLKKMWQDPKFREKLLEAARRARLNPANVGRYNLPTIKGERSDIGFYAQSTWEANFARVLLYCGREFDVRQNFRLDVPEEYKELFPEGKTETNIDFLSLDPRSNLVLYEIMSHPKKDPVGWAKLEMLTYQYPMFRVVPVTERLYRRLERRFEERINIDPLFAGWETKKDNLKSNPAKFQ